MSHKDEAERLLGMTHYDAYPCAQVHATLALVEAQEAVAEQSRIANLIALYVAGPESATRGSVSDFASEAWDLLAAAEARDTLGFNSTEAHALGIQEKA